MDRDPLDQLVSSHRRLEERLAELADAARALADEDQRDEARAVIDDVLAFLERSVTRHEHDEEASLFPRLGAVPGLGEVLDRLREEHGVTDAGLLADLYHLAVNGDDVDRVIADHGARVAHVQIADAPGRNEPGTGSLPLERQLCDLESAGYRGWVGLEYKPAGTTLDSLGWLPPERRAATAATSTAG